MTINWRVSVNYGAGLPTDEKTFDTRHPADALRAVAADWDAAQQRGGISMGKAAEVALDRGYAPMLTVTLQAQPVEAVQ